MKYRVILEIESDDVSADDILNTLDVYLPDSDDFTVEVLQVRIAGD